MFLTFSIFRNFSKSSCISSTKYCCIYCLMESCSRGVVFL